ncbi:MAG TPA: NRDE family protein [Geobacteraceae bacterium]|nr:NRDE family protein [Geobacteraceae bacterium]
MCLILLAFDCHPRYRLIIAANRDEYFSRPTASAAFWDEHPQLLAGRDLKGGGTWLGITQTGRIAALTNYRDPGAEKPDAPSRGHLVSGFLAGAMPADEYLSFLKRESPAYNGFSLIFGDPGRLLFHSNRGEGPQFIRGGIHGLSNHLLDTPWPKVDRGRKALARIVADEDIIQPDALFAILADRTVAPDALLPDTGVGIELERLLSPLFTATPIYGTRSSTVVLMDREDRVFFSERTFNGRPEMVTSVTREFRIAR